ncbi:MAG: hypothetical protein ACE5DM_01775 [Candidatus Nanoarchaeia archaeon]
MEKKAVELIINDDYADKIIEQLQKMKENHNKLVRLTNADQSLSLVISHKDNDLNKKDANSKAE